MLGDVLIFSYICNNLQQHLIFWGGTNLRPIKIGEP